MLGYVTTNVCVCLRLRAWGLEAARLGSNPALPQAGWLVLGNSKFIQQNSLDQKQIKLIHGARSQIRYDFGKGRPRGGPRESSGAVISYILIWVWVTWVCSFGKH